MPEKKSKPPAKTPRIPALYRNGKYACLTHRGKRIYLGRWNTPEAAQAYREWVSDYIRNGFQAPLPPAKGDGLTVAVLCATFLQHTQTKAFSPSHQFCIESVLRTMNHFYGDLPASEFGTLRLMRLREIWIRGEHADPPKPLRRGEVSRRVGFTRRVFKHAASREMIPFEHYQRLTLLEPLDRGEMGVKESDPVRPVDLDTFERTLKHMPETLRAALKVIRYTGARPGEVLALKVGDINRDDPEVWTANIVQHKNRKRGKTRTLYFGKQAQEALRPYLLQEPERYVFNPHKAMAERHAQAPTHRRPNQKPNPKKTDRTLNESYATQALGKAIRRACDDAGIPQWNPNQVRHLAATELRRQFGIEAAQAILGHANLSTTEIYAEQDAEKAKRVIAEIG